MRHAPLPLLLLLFVCAPAHANEPTAIHVYPAAIQLDAQRDRQGFVVQASYADGGTRDVTDEATIALADADIAALDGQAVVPRSDGTTFLRVGFGEHRLEVPVVVKGSSSRRAVSFRNDCLPVITRAGCNSGSCHGSSRGKDGFRLSLFAYDPQGDYRRITREMTGRRINLQVPEASLLLTKSAGRVRHTGGKRLDPAGPGYAVLRDWLAAGAPADSPQLAQLTGIQLYPATAVLRAGEGTQRLIVMATYADGSDRDVTQLARLLSSDTATAHIDAGGTVKAGQRGEAQIIARFGEFTVGAQVLVVPDAPDYVFNEPPTNHLVDGLIGDKLRAMKIQPSPLVGDARFVRRVTLDVAGVLPTPEEAQAFIADPDPEKRAKLVDRLLDREEFVELWVMLWAERLLIRSSQDVSDKAVLRYAAWLKQKLSSGVTIDALTVDLLTATGGVFDTPQTNFYQAEKDNQSLAENVAQVFLGMRIQCAQCHNHPFDRWTQDDYYGWSAFFSQVGRKRGADPRETIVFNRNRGEAKHPVTKKPVPPKFLGGERPDTKRKDRRRVAAEWIVSKDNPYFARNLVNMVWTQLFGTGIVHEPDDFRVSNPPSIPALLDALASLFAESGYDLKALVRLIATSRAYQRSTRTNPTNALDTRNFSRAYVRRLRAEVLLDAISQVTDSPGKFKGLPLGARAVQVADGSTANYFLKTFGRSSRTSVCSCEAKVEPNLSQALHLMNGDTVNGKIRKGKLVKRRLAAKVEPIDVARELYWRCLTRAPTEAEETTLRERLAQPNVHHTLDDLFWALLNSREFLFQH